MTSGSQKIPKVEVKGQNDAFFLLRFIEYRRIG